MKMHYISLGCGHLPKAHGINIMKKVISPLKRMTLSVSVFLSLFAGTIHADEVAVDVTALNYVPAKTAMQFDKYLAKANGKLNLFAHGGSVAGINSRSVHC